jgi:PIN domain nuclease of toxin-antitoxin system
VILLLDTHAFLWFVWDDPLLSTMAKLAIQDPTNRKLVSVASCWEIAIKTGNRKLTLGAPAEAFVKRELARNNFDLLDIKLEHATAVEALPLHHKDPFDRLLIVQTQIEGLSIVSVDAAFDPYGIARIW